MHPPSKLSPRNLTTELDKLNHNYLVETFKSKNRSKKRRRRRRSAHTRTLLLKDKRDQREDTKHSSDGGGKGHSWPLLYLDEGTRPCCVPIKQWHLVGPIRGAVRPRLWVHLLTLIRHLLSLILFFFFFFVGRSEWAVCSESRPLLIQLNSTSSTVLDCHHINSILISCMQVNTYIRRLAGIIGWKLMVK